MLTSTTFFKNAARFFSPVEVNDDNRCELYWLTKEMKTDYTTDNQFRGCSYPLISQNTPGKRSSAWEWMNLKLDFRNAALFLSYLTQWGLTCAGKENLVEITQRSQDLRILNNCDVCTSCTWRHCSLFSIGKDTNQMVEVGLGNLDFHWLCRE